jgi:hypothetical protein
MPFGLDIFVNIRYKYIMNKKAIIIFFIIIFINGCSNQKLLFNYRIDLSKNELKIIKQYIKKYDNLDDKIYIKNKYLYSNDMHLLIKMKIRLEGIAYNYYPYIPIIINYENNYYYINSINDYEELKKINWLDDNEIYNKLEKDIKIIEMNIPIEMLNLSKEDFIIKYLKNINDNIYLPNVERELFNNEKDKLYENIILLSQIKYEMMVKSYHNSGIRIIDLDIERIYNN